jgi:prepilin signal peptidase PulO-like enzyme (type II secretory pathway)
MVLMKYVMNHEEEFTHPTFSYVLLLWALLILFMIEALNIFQILFWSTVEFTVIYLMAFKIITWIPKLYYDSLTDDKLKEKLC